MSGPHELPSHEPAPTSSSQPELQPSRGSSRESTSESTSKAGCNPGCNSGSGPDPVPAPATSSADEPCGTITRLLARADAGDRAALEELIRVAEPDLRALAGQIIRRYPRADDLGVTALVNEGIARLLGRGPIPTQTRRMFFGILGQRMRDALLDALDHDHAAKRRPRAGVASLADVDPVAECTDIDFDRPEMMRAAAEVAQLDPIASVAFVFYKVHGRPLAEIAALIGLDEQDAKAEIVYAHFLFRRAIRQ